MGGNVTVVVDSNMVVALILPLPFSNSATEAFRRWRADGERLVAPALLEYELTSVVRNGLVQRKLRAERAQQVLDQMLQSGLEIIVPTLELHRQALHFAERIGQSKAYDAQYLALASRENAPLWTADRRLANAARDTGLNWVHWIGDWEA